MRYFTESLARQILLARAVGRLLAGLPERRNAERLRFDRLIRAHIEEVRDFQGKKI